MPRGIHVISHDVVGVVDPIRDSPGIGIGIIDHRGEVPTGIKKAVHSDDGALVVDPLEDACDIDRGEAIYSVAKAAGAKKAKGTIRMTAKNIK